ncbi:S-adenosyl-L-methionine-dependent methyltransferase [Xylariaceae sp. FL0255]|nr:S-adenosyl-L-methionine-dependent methyltransferase [Xylariaceae sp. FL0255]
MGRKGRRGGGRGGGGRGGGFRTGNAPRTDAWSSGKSDLPKENEKLENFYNRLLPFDEAEKEEFWKVIRTDLPNSFRFCGSKGHALAVKRLLEERYAPEISKIEHFNGDAVEPPQPVPWYPDQLAYSMNTPKQVIRRFPPFASFQKFLVSETSVGNISRQELVSMIPPLVLDVKPGMTVLDLCAAPGSKSSQLVEMIHTGEEARISKFLESFGETSIPVTKEEEDVATPDEDNSDHGRATGLLIANDVEYKRCHMLVHQLKRLSSPNLIVMNHDATQFPPLRLPKDPTKPKARRYLKFDRILADVPCSGDGTLRKNMDLWRYWVPGGALGLHPTQVRILVKALQMLKVGGRVVFSTCSMNPVENESVVVSAIERCGGPENIEIIDCKDRLPLLKRYPGMHQWQVIDKSGRIWNNWEEVEHYMAPGKDMPGKISPTMFPRPDTSDCSGLPLDRCMRIYPHQQNTGGFFITVLEKKKEFKAKPESKFQPGTSTAEQNEDPFPDDESLSVEQEIVEEAKAAVGEPSDEIPPIGSKRTLEDDQNEDGHANKKQRTETPPAERVEKIAEIVTETSAAKEEDLAEEVVADKPVHSNDAKGKRGKEQYEEPFKYLAPDHPAIEHILNFYNISAQFPTDRYMVRNAAGEPAKAIYYSSALVRDILVANEGLGVKFIHGGLKMFMKQDSPSAEVCRWRIQSEGLPIISGYVGDERKVRLTNKETLHTLLREMFPKFVDDDWQKLGEIGERARDIAMGCCILNVEPDGTDPAFSERMVLPLWKSFHSLNLMLPKEDRSAMLLRLFNDTSPVINMSLKDSAKLKAEQEAAAQKGEGVEKEAEVEGNDEQGAEDGDAMDITAEDNDNDNGPRDDTKKVNEVSGANGSGEETS